MHHAIRRPERERDYILLLQQHNCYCVMLWWQQVRREKIGERMKFLQDLVPGCNKVWKNNNKLCSPTSAWFLLVQKFWSFLVVMMCIQYFHVFISCLFRPLPLFFVIFKKVEGEFVWSLNFILSVHVALWASGHRKGHDARWNNQLCAISSTTSWGIQNFLVAAAAASVVPSRFCTSVLNSKGISLAVARKTLLQQ